MAKTNFQSLDEYIESCPPASQAHLRQIRALIRALAPAAQEKISYQIACFALNGKNFIHFAGWKKHVSLYPIPAGNAAFQSQIEPYVDGKGTLKFSLEEPLPARLVEAVIRQHLQANQMKGKNE